MENTTIERTKREMEIITDRQKRFTMFSRFLLNTEIIVKEPKKGQFKAKFMDYSDDCEKVTLEIPNSTLTKGLRITMNKFIGRYICLEGEIIGISPGSLYTINISKLSLAQKSRGSNRITPPKDLVWTTNFRITRASWDTDSFSIPAYIKIIFNDCEKKLMGIFDKINIDIFRSGMEEKYFIVKSTGKSIYIKDTQDKRSYSTNNEKDFLNCDEEFLDDISGMMKDFRNKKIVSEVIMPIIYTNGTEDSTTLGFVLINSLGKKIEEETLKQAKMLTSEMVEKIRDSNTFVSYQKTEILNLSIDGLKIKITDPDLKQHILNVKGFTMEIVFKSQSPISISVFIRNIANQDNGDMIVGLEIDGFGVNDKERFIDNFDQLRKRPR
jgi:hypothetical protein